MGGNMGKGIIWTSDCCGVRAQPVKKGLVMGFVCFKCKKPCVIKMTKGVRKI